MSPLDPSSRPPSPSAGPELPGWLRATGVLLWGPLGAVLAVVLAVGAAALVAGGAPGSERLPPTWTESAGGIPSREISGAPASLWVSSAPSGAVVEVGGDSVGVTPTWVRGLSPGRVRVTVRLRSLVLDSVVSLGPAADRDLAFWFDPGLVAAVAEEAPTLVDPARTDASQEPRVIPERPAPPAGPAETARRPTRAARPGPRSSPEPPLVVARPEIRTEARTEASPPPQAPRRGTLEVSVPPGSAVLINGRVVVRSSGARYRTSLPPGSHRVRVVYPSTSDEEATVYVGGSVTTMVSFGPDPSAPEPRQ